MTGSGPVSTCDRQNRTTGYDVTVHCSVVRGLPPHCWVNRRNSACRPPTCWVLDVTVARPCVSQPVAVTGGESTWNGGPSKRQAGSSPPYAVISSAQSWPV